MPELGKATYELVFDTSQVKRIDAAEAQVVSATDGMETAIVGLEASIASLSESVGVLSARVGPEFAAAGAGATEMATEIEAASAKAAASSTKGAATAGTAWASAGKKMSAIGKTMTHKITLPVLVVGGLGTKMFLDYSQKIKLLNTQAGASVEEMNHMRKAILDMDKDGSTIHGPTQLADAMYHIESAGIRGAAALDVLKTASNGAMVGNAGLEETTYALVSAFESQAKGTTDVGEAMANINAIIGAGDMRLEDLTGALSTGIIPSAKGAGLGIRDIGAALDTMTSRGMPAQQAATRLGMTIAMMQKPTSAAAKSLAAIGIGQLDLARIMRAKGLPAALDYLVEKLKTVQDPAKRAAIVLSAFGGGRSGKAMLLLLQNLEDVHHRYDQIGASAKNFEQAVKDAKAEPINRLKAAWAQLEVTLVQIGAAVTPFFVKIAQGIVKIIGLFGRLPGPVKKVMLAIILLAAAVGPLLRVVGFLFLGFKRLAVAARWIMGIRSAMVATTVATEMTTAAVATATLGWVLFAAAGVAAVYEIVNHIPLIGSALRSVGHWFGGKIADAAGIGSGDNAANGAAGAQAKGNATMVYSVRARYKLLADSGMKRESILTAMSRDPQFAGLSADALSTYTQGNPKTWAMNAGTGKLPAPRAKKDPLFGKLGVVKDPNAGGNGSLLPIDMQIAEATAMRQGKAAQLAVYKREDAFLRGLLSKTKDKSKILAIQQALSSNFSSEQSLKGAGGGKVKGGIIPNKLELAYQKALQTKGAADDVKALKAEETYLKGLLKNRKLSAAKQIEILKALTAVKKKLADAKKKQVDEGHAIDKEMQAYVDTRGTFFNEFASSVFHAGEGGGLDMGAASGGGSTKTYNQHNSFNEIPKDRFALGRQMARGAAHAM